MKTSLICISLLAFLVIVLATNVVISRIRTQTLFGYSQSPDNVLYKAVRAHMNAIEYIPLGAILIYILGNYDQSYLNLLFVYGFVISRILAALGIIFCKTLDKVNLLRFIGTLGSIVTLTGLAFILFMQSIDIKQ